MISVYIFKLTFPINDKDKFFILSELDISERKSLPKQEGQNFEHSLIGRVLAKKIVSNEMFIPHNSVLIGKNKLGKPIIKKPSGLNFDISISHSDNYLAIGICDNGKIGVDIEFLTDRNFEIFKKCLSVDEEIYINSGEGTTQRLENFYEIWTRKEACLKALGTGLQKPLPITEFYSGHNKPRTKIRYNNKGYYLSTVREDKFILSICTTKSSKYCQKYIKLTPNQLKIFLSSNSNTTSSNF